MVIGFISCNPINRSYIEESWDIVAHWKIIKEDSVIVADVDKVKAILLETAKAIPEACKMENEKPIEVMVVAHADSAIQYRIRIWCDAADYWTITFGMNENVKKAFDREGISIPYPQMDVHVINK